MNETGTKLGWLEKAIWRWYVIPMLREGLVLRALAPGAAARRSSRPGGPGRVDTFNPYKLIQADMPLEHAPAERSGSAPPTSRPSFDSGPREGMKLHWDGNNTSLAERNLSAAIGAGVTPSPSITTAIERVAALAARPAAAAEPLPA